MTEQACQRQRNDGSPCRAPAVLPSGFCFAHDPVREEERKAARIAGGKARKRVVAPDDGGLPPELKDPKTALKAMWQALLDVRAGRLDVKVANSIAILGGQVLRAMEVSDMGERLAALEGLLAEEDEEHRTDKRAEESQRRRG